MPLALLEGEFTGNGQSNTVEIQGKFNISLSGFGDATVTIQRSFDQGVTFKNVEAFTADTEKRGDEVENLVYRFDCSSYVSGTIRYRISR